MNIDREKWLKENIMGNKENEKLLEGIIYEAFSKENIKKMMTELLEEAKAKKTK